MNRFEQEHKSYSLQIFHTSLCALYPETLRSTESTCYAVHWLSARSYAFWGFFGLLVATGGGSIPQGLACKILPQFARNRNVRRPLDVHPDSMGGRNSKRKRRGLRLGVYVFRLEFTWEYIVMRGQSRRQVPFGLWKPSSQYSSSGNYRSGRGSGVAVTLRNVERCR